MELIKQVYLTCFIYTPDKMILFIWSFAPVIESTNDDMKSDLTVTMYLRLALVFEYSKSMQRCCPSHFKFLDMKFVIEVSQIYWLISNILYFSICCFASSI